MKIRWPKGLILYSNKKNSQELDVSEQQLKLSLLLENFNTRKDDISELDYRLFLRFLKARQFNVDKATLMLRNYFTWREKNNISEIINNTQVPIKLELYPRAYHGVDKLGRPIYVDCIGISNIKKLLELYPEMNFFNHWIYEYEFLVNVISTSCHIFNILKSNSQKCVINSANKEKVMNILNSEYFEIQPFETLNIIDLNGFTLGNFDGSCRKIIKELVYISQNYYPELLGKMVVINAPSIFSIIWNFVKPLIDEKTAKKISIYTQHDNWKSVLLEFIDEDQLPRFLGGNPSYEGEWLNANFGPWSNPTILECIAEKYPEIPKQLIFSHFVSKNNENLPEN
ncbi:SEC14 domain containing protein [Cryptosporidium ryanae]|uniref:SEC14 domain containing protein n=1 Tax=Cryptosporidium ryanae TaxID=515981 RepID=UPI00351AAC81|nr:SEC14 domain containing protein [Cryptosporidium ryanae]